MSKPHTIIILLADDEGTQNLKKYWFKIVSLPAEKKPGTYGGCPHENFVH
jgi:hypothetical protein